MRPRLGFLGVGWIGRNRLEAIVASGLADVVALADASPEALDATLPLVPSARVCDSLEALLGADLDGVVIATPSALHAAQSIQALEAGVAVFSQKPLARTGPECARVLDVARRRNRLLGVDLSYRHVRGVDRMRELLRSGELGSLVGAQLVFHNAYGPDKPWFHDARLSGGGCLMDLGIHLVDLALWLLEAPRVETVYGALRRRGRPLCEEGEVEDHASATLELAGGAVVQLACSWNLPAGREAVIEASFFGTVGGVSLRNVEGSFYDFTVERFHGTRRERLAGPPDAWGGRAAVAWTRQLAAGRDFDPAIDQLLQVAAVLDRIYGR